MDSVEPPKSLVEFQRGFRATVTGSKRVLGRAQNIYEMIDDDRGISKKERLDIYANAWFSRLKESLEEDYENLSRCLGGDHFEQMIRDYLEEMPPNSYTLAHAGDRLPEFLTTWKHSRKRPWHIDLAKLERNYYQALFAKNPEPWDLSNFVHSSFDHIENLKLGTEASVFLLQSSWKIHQIVEKKASRPLRAKQYYLVYRKRFKVSFKRVSEKAFKILVALRNGITLGEVIDLYPERSTVDLLVKWASNGIIKPLSRLSG